MADFTHSDTARDADTTAVQGTLRTTPFDHVLLRLHRRKEHGTLVLGRDWTRGDDAILIEDGYVVAARLADPKPSLRDGLIALLHRTEPYAFHARRDLVTPHTAVQVDAVHPWEVLGGLVRVQVREEPVNAVVDAIPPHAWLRLKEGYAWEQLALEPSEERLLQPFREHGASLAAFLQWAGRARPRARKLVYVLVQTRAFTEALRPWESDTQVSPSAFDAMTERDAVQPAMLHDDLAEPTKEVPITIPLDESSGTFPVPREALPGAWDASDTDPGR